MQEILQEACAQLIKKEDLKISKEVAQVLREETLAASIKNKPEPLIRIFSHKQLILSDILPVITDYGFRILNEVSFASRLDQQEIYISKFRIDLEEPKLFKAHKKNIIESLLKTLRDKETISCKLFRLIYKEDFCIRGILLFRAIVL